MKKDVFIERLINLSREQINQLIQEKGKGPKVVDAVYYSDDEQKYPPAFRYDE